MSCSWDIHCLECNEESGLNLNHGLETCFSLIKAREAFEKLAELLDPNLMFNPLTVWGEIGTVHHDFYLKHKGHVLVPVSEYMDLGDECLEWEHVEGSIHTTGRRCHLFDRHDGDHVFEERLSSPYEAWPATRLKALERRRVVR